MKPQYNIAVVLPKNNPFCSTVTKPVVNACLPYIVNSKYVNNIVVLSAFTNTPIHNFNNTNINVSVGSKLNSSSKQNYYKWVVSYINANNIKVIEVHQDTKLASFIATNCKNTVVCLHKHVNYFINRFKEQFKIINWWYYYKYLKNISKIYAISNFVATQLSQKQPLLANKIFTIYNSYGHLNYNLNNVTSKQKQIIFAGKPVANKGIVPLILALQNILSTHLDYTAVLVVANFSGKAKYLKQFNGLISKPNIKQLIDNKRLIIHYNLNANSVFKHMQQSNIAVVPSVFNEPFGLVAIEASLAKCLLVSSGSGALKEITTTNAFYSSPVTVNNLVVQINNAIKHINLHGNNTISPMALSNYNYCVDKFNIKNLMLHLDNYRSKNIAIN